jgi:preprotein translocase subunit SecF
MNLNLFDIRKLMITLLMLSLIWLLSSCGTRKVQKSVVKESSTTEQVITEKKDIVIDSQTNTVISNESNEIEVTPIDTSKVLIINGKTYKNAKVKILNRKSQTKIEANESVKDNTVKTVKVVTETKRDNKEIATERKSNPFLPLLWLLIPIIIYILWRNKPSLL